MAEQTALKTVEPAGIVRAAVPPDEIGRALVEYRAIQAELDKAMPDCLMTIGDRQFRKKSYWRAVATAFNLDVECVSEHVSPRKDWDWGFTVTYRATAPSGRHADGDGACYASEKTVYAYRGGPVDEEKTRNNQTVHNVRGHAHTRAFNRAVSNLVGFGEVSAEEMEYDAPAPAATATRKHTQPSAAPSGQPPAPQGQGVGKEGLKRAGYWPAVFKAAERQYGKLADDDARKFNPSDEVQQALGIKSANQIRPNQMQWVMAFLAAWASGSAADADAAATDYEEPPQAGDSDIPF